MTCSRLHFAAGQAFPAVLFALTACPATAQRTLLRESFEGTSRTRWQHTWGSAEATTEQAHGGQKSLKCLVEDKYGMSVHYCDFRPRVGAT